MENAERARKEAIAEATLALKGQRAYEEALKEYLNMPVPWGWRKLSFLERKNYWKGGRTTWTGRPRERICAAEVAMEFFEIERSNYSLHEGRRVSEAILATGLFVKTGKRQRFGDYGIVLEWVRKK